MHLRQAYICFSYDEMYNDSRRWEVGHYIRQGAQRELQSTNVACATKLMVTMHINYMYAAAMLSSLTVLCFSWSHKSFLDKETTENKQGGWFW